MDVMNKQDRIPAVDDIKQIRGYQSTMLSEVGNFFVEVSETAYRVY